MDVDAHWWNRLATIEVNEFAGQRSCGFATPAIRFTLLPNGPLCTIAR
jgi:hypothetical protein